MIGTQIIEHRTQAEPQDSGHRSVEEGRPVATELDAESAAGKPGTDRYLPRGVVTFAGTDFFQLLLVFFQRIVLADGSPGEFADGGNSSHVDAVFFATLEFGKRMFFVAQVYHQHVVVDVNMQVFVGQSQVGRRAFHVAHDAARVRRAFHQ